MWSPAHDAVCRRHPELVAAYESPQGNVALLLQHMGKTLEEQWQNEMHYTRNVVRGAKADDAFPEFIARKGRTGG